MRYVDRRSLLAGLASGVGAAVLRGAPAAAAVREEPPADGPLAASSVSALLRQCKIPGASLAIMEGGELVASYGYGTMRIDTDRPVTPQTLFQACSLTKTINALAVLRLAQAGRLGLDDAVNAHLLSWKLPDNALTHAMPVSVRMLLSHTGGTTVHGFRGYNRNALLPTLAEILDGKQPANSAAVRVNIPPGTAVRYSGGGTVVLQQMVIDVTGEAYPGALRRLVLAPLGMSASTFDQPRHGDALNRHAFGHDVEGSAVPGGFHIRPEYAAGGLWTTARDMSIALMAIVGAQTMRRNDFLDARWVREMMTPVRESAALGTFVEGGRLGHSGHNVGYRALYVHGLASGRGMVAMANGDEPALAKALLRRVAEVHEWRL
jgi:CubicO group peptidase (beta-lactamase class C family)